MSRKDGWLAPVLVLAVLAGVFATLMLTRLGAKPKARARAKPKPVPVVPVAKPKPAEPKPANRLPAVLNAALAGNRVVVVGLYDPASAVDKISLDEARPGAEAAGVGFVAINVFAEAQLSRTRACSSTAGPTRSSPGSATSPTARPWRRLLHRRSDAPEA